VAKRRSWTIVFVPDDESGPRQIRIGPVALRLLVALGVLSIVLVGVGAATYWRVADVALESSAVKQENARLAEEAQKVWELERTVVDMLEMDYKIRSRLGIEFPADWPGYNYELGPEDIEQAGDQQADPGRQATANTADERPSGAALLLAWPITRGFPTSGYGEGTDATGEPHTGVDIAAQRNAPVRAAADGRVTLAERNERFGNTIEIDHGYGLVTMYGHNARIVARSGELVRRGDIRCGRTAGPLIP
jgi:murein DD-endopeptidase MepM/ murein hydrolase activator NlpD